MLHTPRPRKPRSRRPAVYPDVDLYFLRAEQLRAIMGYSRYYFYHRVLRNTAAYGVPPSVVLGPTFRGQVGNYPNRYGIFESVRYRADELYTLRPDLSPYPPDSCWLARFKARAAVDRESYIAQRAAERSVRPAAA